jgi:ABC-type branched-subunit amino acid transport system ATPase component
VGFRRRDRSELGSAYERFPILRERRGLLAGSLSGGEQQMLAIARLWLRYSPLWKAHGVTMLLVEQNAPRLGDRA